MKTTVIVAMVLALLGGAFSCVAQQLDMQCDITPDDPPASAKTRRYGTSSRIPINLTYGELSPAERKRLHARWEHIADGDEPPFPVDGLASIYEATSLAQQVHLVVGKLTLIATVEPDGTVSQVKALGSPSAELTQTVASVLLLTKFKPAVCSGQPCRMDFPLDYEFRVEAPPRRRR